MKLNKSMMLTKQELTKGERNSPWFSVFIALVILLVGSTIPVVIAGFLSIDLSKEANELLFTMLGFPIVLLILLLVNKYYYKKTVSSLGFFYENTFKKYMYGIVLGFSALLFIYMINVVLSSVSTIINKDNNLFVIIVVLLGFLVQGLTEEVLTRGFIMTIFSSQKGVTWGIVVNSIFFAVIHSANPGLKPLAMINLLIFGIVFSLLFYWSDNIWLTGAAHSMWNFTMGSILGVGVSGQKLLHSLFITTSYPEKTVINGGEFGFEGGIVATLFGIASCVILWSLCRKNKLID